MSGFIVKEDEADFVFISTETLSSSLKKKFKKINKDKKHEGYVNSDTLP